MAGVRIVTDSSCDLPADLADVQGITIVPLSIRFGSEELVDRRDLTSAQFWERCAASPVLPETAAPAPGLFAEAYRAALDGGADGVVCINISSKLSATIQSAQAAANDLPDGSVRVVDSRSVTMGLGMIVLEAAKAAADGASMDDVISVANRASGKNRVLGSLDTLENLKKGGRVGGAQALIGSLLSIKPLISVQGVVEEAGRARTRS